MDDELRAALRPLVDEPPAAPPPVAAIAARARRRHTRRRTALGTAAAALLLAVVVTASSLTGPGDVTETTEPAPDPDPAPAATAPPAVPGTPEDGGRPPGTEPTTTATTAEPSPAGSTVPGATRPHDPFDALQAEDHDAQQGVVVTEADGADGGRTVSGVGDGDHLAYRQVDFGPSLATRFEARIASGTGPGVDVLVEVRLDDVASPPFATFPVGGTGGWERFTTVGVDTPAIGGRHDVYVTFASPHPGDLAVIDWFRFVP